MFEENISQEFRLKNINETINHFVEEIDQTELISNKHKKVCLTGKNQDLSTSKKPVGYYKAYEWKQL